LNKKSALLLNSSALHDHQEIILIWQFGAQKTFIIIIIENNQLCFLFLFFCWNWYIFLYIWKHFFVTM